MMSDDIQKLIKEQLTLLHNSSVAKKSDKQLAGFEASSASKTTIDKNTVQKIYSKVWGPDRDNELYKRLAKEYNTTYNIVSTIARAGHLHNTRDDVEQYANRLQQWHEKYGYYKKYYIVRSPGNDLLERYDEYQLRRSPIKRGKLKVSEIFDIRFRWKDKSRKVIKAYCDSKGIKVDGAMYDTYRDKTMRWLVDQPHTEYRFENFPEMGQWMFDRINRPFPGGGAFAEVYCKKGMIWQDKKYNLNGWSFEIVDRKITDYK